MGRVLNPYQQRAVLAHGHCVVLACPGSGKTAVLEERVARLLQENATGRVCAVTFTNDSAHELSVRIEKLVGKKVMGSRTQIGTFHALARGQIIEQHGIDAVRMISESTRHQLISRAWREHGKIGDLETIKRAIDQRKSSVERGQTFMDESTSLVYNTYNDLLRSGGVIDFPDLLIRTVNEMGDGDMPPINCRWLLVDEAQDLDEMQLAWVYAHSMNGIQTTLVGDDDQSLYSFRNALGYEGLCHFIESMKAEKLTLSINYRCGSKILEHASRLISFNSNRASKRIEAGNPSSGSVLVFRKQTRDGEHNEIVRSIESSEMPDTWAILARTSSILDDIESALTAASIPYSRIGGKSVWEQKTPSAFLGVLHSLVTNNWVGVTNALDFAGMDERTLNLLSSYESNQDCADRLKKISFVAQQKNLEPEYLSILDKFSTLYGEWHQNLLDKRYAMVIYAVGEWFLPYIQKSEHKEIFRRLFVAVASMKGTLNQRLRSISAKKKNTGEGVSLMTLHGSKGLEFENVWIPSAVEGTLPHTDGPIEEERRIMYVGMTRAKQNLCISFAHEDGLESRFIAEAGLEL